MKELVNRIQAVINTLNSVTVSGFDNLDMMLGCMKELADVRETIKKIPEGKQDGNADTE